jgi:chloride channel 3/4/5
MQPQRNEALDVITQDSTSLRELKEIMKTTDHNGFPVVVSK